MFLRSITKHVNDQNWLAVLLDFFIVVAGILIAFQITNWNEARQQRLLSDDYLERLHEEITLAEVRHQETSKELETTVFYLKETVEALTSADEQLSLSRNQCDAVFSSHIYRPVQVSTPTIEEMLTSGRASMLSDGPLRAQILKLVQLQAATQAQRDNHVAGIPNLAVVFPEKIKLNPRIEYDRFGFAPLGGHSCHIDRMRDSSAFTNSLIDNLYRMDAFLKLNFSPEGTQIAHVHALIDNRLGIHHAGRTDLIDD